MEMRKDFNFTVASRFLGNVNVRKTHFKTQCPPESSIILSVTDCSNGTIASTSCCTSSNPCGEGEGDCDSDEDCMGNLKCGEGSGHNDNCDNTLGFSGDSDCCYDADKG